MRSILQITARRYQFLVATDSVMSEVAELERGNIADRRPGAAKIDFSMNSILASSAIPRRLPLNSFENQLKTIQLTVLICPNADVPSFGQQTDPGTNN